MLKFMCKAPFNETDPKVQDHLGLGGKNWRKKNWKSDKKSEEIIKKEEMEKKETEKKVESKEFIKLLIY